MPVHRPGSTGGYLNAARRTSGGGSSGGLTRKGMVRPKPHSSQRDIEDNRERAMNARRLEEIESDYGDDESYDGDRRRHRSRRYESSDSESDDDPPARKGRRRHRHVSPRQHSNRRRNDRRNIDTPPGTPPRSLSPGIKTKTNHTVDVDSVQRRRKKEAYCPKEKKEYEALHETIADGLNQIAMMGEAPKPNIKKSSELELVRGAKGRRAAASKRREDPSSNKKVGRKGGEGNVSVAKEKRRSKESDEENTLDDDIVEAVNDLMVAIRPRLLTLPADGSKINESGGGMIILKSASGGPVSAELCADKSTNNMLTLHNVSKYPMTLTTTNFVTEAHFETINGLGKGPEENSMLVVEEEGRIRMTNEDGRVVTLRNDIGFTGQVCCMGQDVFFGVVDGKVAYKMSMGTTRWEPLEPSEDTLDEATEGFLKEAQGPVSMAMYGGVMWVADRSGMIFKWDVRNDEDIMVSMGARLDNPEQITVDERVGAFYVLSGGQVFRQRQDDWCPHKAPIERPVSKIAAYNNALFTLEEGEVVKYIRTKDEEGKPSWAVHPLASEAIDNPSHIEVHADLLYVVNNETIFVFESDTLAAAGNPFGGARGYQDSGMIQLEGDTSITICVVDRDVIVI